MEKLISIDLKGDFGFFRKPDANNTVNLSYNMLHKPALLGIFGAIIGLEGYSQKGKLPQYFEFFETLKVGIEPLNHEKGSFGKALLTFSDTTGFNNKDKNNLPATRIIEEAILVKPSYRIFALLDMENEHHAKLYAYLKAGIAEYLPYFGKNEFAIWWDKENFKEYEYQERLQNENSIKVKTLFLKQDIVNEQKTMPILDSTSISKQENPFMYFERLPKGFDTTLFQYELGDFVLTTYSLKSSVNIENIYYLPVYQAHVQLF